MINYDVMMDPATELFHSRDMSELFGVEEPYDLAEIVAQTGLGPRDLAGLAPGELIRLLRDHGIEGAQIDPTALGREIASALGT